MHFKWGCRVNRHSLFPICADTTNVFREQLPQSSRFQMCCQPEFKRTKNFLLAIIVIFRQVHMTYQAQPAYSLAVASNPVPSSIPAPYHRSLGPKSYRPVFADVPSTVAGQWFLNFMKQLDLFLDSRKGLLYNGCT